MPIYTYLCKKCKGKFDLLVGVNQEKKTLECPHCKSKDIERVFSSFAISGTDKSSSCSSCQINSCSTCR